MILDQCVRKGQAGAALSDADVEHGAKWNEKRALTAALSDFMIRAGREARADLEKYGEALGYCSLRLFLQFWSDGSKSVRPFMSCKRRWCPLCAWRKSVKNFQIAIRKLGEWFAANPSDKFYFLTLTVPNCSADDLPELVKSMNAAWRRFSLRPSFSTACVGWVRSLEITFPRKGEAHPHFHVLMVSKHQQRAWSLLDLRRIWTECMQMNVLDFDDGRGLICNIQKVKPGEGETESEALVRSVGQVLKYSIKPMAEMAMAEWAVPKIAEMKRARFIASGGVFRSIFVEPETDEERRELDGQLALFWTADESLYRHEVGDA